MGLETEWHEGEMPVSSPCSDDLRSVGPATTGRWRRPGPGELRRLLGPTAWMVLEELWLRADASGRVPCGVRAMGRDLGLDKDTVARALQRLREVGLVDRRADGYQLRGGAAVVAAMEMIGDAQHRCPHERDNRICPVLGDSRRRSAARRDGPPGGRPGSIVASGVSGEHPSSSPAPASPQPTLFDSQPTASST